MKKLARLILCIAIFTVMLASLAFAKTYSVKFDTQDKVTAWLSAIDSDTTYSFDSENKALKVTNGSTDPYFRHDFSFLQYLKASDYKYFYYRFKILDGLEYADKGQFFFGSLNATLGNSGTYSDFDIEKTTNWQDICYDLTALSQWSGYINKFRVDFVQQNSFNPVTALIDTIVFCSEESEVTALKNECKAMNPSLEWTFDTYENFERHISNLIAYDYSGRDGYVVLKPTENDPIFNLPLNNTETLDADTLKYIAFRMKVDSDIDLGSLFFETPSYGFAQTRTDFEVHTDNEWHNYIIDMSAAHEYWGGNVIRLRFDFLDRKSTGYITPRQDYLDSEIILDRIGVFETETQAQDFLNKELNCSVIFPYDEIINTGAEIPTWDFRNDSNIESTWIPSGGYFTREHGLFGMMAVSTDAVITSHFDENSCFSGDEFKWFGIRIKNSSTEKGGGLYFTNNSNVLDCSDDYFVRFTYSEDGEWENIVINVKKYYPEDWTENITSVRLDLLNPSYNSALVHISRAGFFRSEQEALDYLNAANDTPDYSQEAIFKSDFQRVFVPGGTLSDGYKKSNYMLSSTTPIGEGENPVVLFTDINGTQSVIALSDINSYGYARFVSRKPGNYVIGYNPSSFTDIQGHWAEEYITYVTDREVLSGTSQNEFSPDMPITRGMFVTALGRMHGLDETDYSGNTGYTDVSDNAYYAPYINWALSNDIMSPINETQFSPEQSLTRYEMAMALSNYADAFGFDHVFYNDTDEFTDISNQTDEIALAIQKLQKWGVMAGISNTEFDPSGISTRAEAAVVIRNMIKSLTGAALPETEYTNEDITRKRIRLGVWSFEFSSKDEVDQLKELGVNLICTGSGAANENVWNLCDKYGIEIFMQDYPLSSTPKKDENGNELRDENNKTYSEFKPVDLKKLTAEYADRPSFGGHYFADEPGTFDMEWIGDAIDEYNGEFPDKTAFVNLLPMYANAAQLKYGAGAAEIKYYDTDPELYKKYCQEWFETNNASYICTDIYPFEWIDSIHDNAYKSTYSNYIESINQIATVARENNAEFWCCIQTFGWQSNKRTPNEAEFRWQSYSLLSFGATGILLWRYVGTSPQFPAMVDLKTQEALQAYYDCQAVFSELNKISDIYIKYTNLGAFTHNASDEVKYLKMSAGTEYEKSNTVFSDIQCDNPLLFGYFENTSDNTNAFTVVNMTDFKNNESSVVKFKLTDMTKTVTQYYRGTPQVLTPVNGYYTINLESGDGVFVTVT